MSDAAVRLIAFNKPFRVLCQFRASPGRLTLADFIDVERVHPAGRLDADSEGLVLLTDHGPTQARISAPRFKLAKTYLVQVEGEPDARALQRLRDGVELSDGISRPAEVDVVGPPRWLWPRDPPIRFRKRIPTSWLRVVLREGRNRQLRRMTAAVGYPTLRLIRRAVGPFELGDLAPGHWRDVNPARLRVLI